MQDLISHQQIQASTRPFMIYVGCGFDEVAGKVVLPPLSVLPPREQLIQFSHALFEPDDVVEIRLIAATKQARHASTLVDRKWIRADQLADHDAELNAANEDGCHVYFGVNPRSVQAGTKRAIRLCRSVWLDFDRVAYEQAQANWSEHLPEPTVVVRSGSGIHAYWRLTSPFSVADIMDRSKFERIVQGVSRTVGGDATHDVTRLLRLPGFVNPKPPIPRPCTLLVCEPARRYSISVFEPWTTQPEVEKNPSPLEIENLPTHRERRRICGLIQYLDQEVPDRSRRDFAVVCGLLRLGLSPDEIRPLVAGRSKFAGGEAYLEATIRNALQAVGVISPQD